MKLNHRCLTIAGLFLSVASRLPHDAAGQMPPDLGTGLAVWDTVTPLPGPLFAEDQSEWSKVARNEKRTSFQGDAVATNGKVAIVIRSPFPFVETFTPESEGPVSRGQLHLLAGDDAPVAHLANVSLAENTRAAIRLEVTYTTAEGTAVRATLRVKRGDPFIEVTPGENAKSLRVECESRFVVLPDFFADDIVFDARSIPLQTLETPSENFLLHLIGEGDAIAMCVFENRDQEVRIALAGSGENRVVAASEIDFGENRKIWLAFTTSPQIWHSIDFDASAAGSVKPLDWKMPFPAQWRMDFTRPNDLIDSWEMLLPAKDSSGYLKPHWLTRGASHILEDRKRWTTVLGWFRYPCWIDRDGRGYMEPFRHRALKLQGPAIIYPINRVEATPLDAYTVVDIVRGSLGVGPCEYILNVEGQQQAMRGRATCAARDALNAIYKNGEQKKRQSDIEAALDDALEFVTHIRSRIERYVQFGHDTRKYLAQQREAHPEWGEAIDELEEIVKEIDLRKATRRDKIRTPEFVARMNEDFRNQLLDYDRPDVLKKLKEYTDALTQIGGNQDELVGQCRWIVRSLRQRAGMMMALNPACISLAEEIRARTQEVLAKPASYEAARH
ncbi:MAG: hypothetical protein ACC628_02710 [Pirellulaceae bacterium]